MISVPFNLAKFEEALGLQKFRQFQAQAETAKWKATESVLSEKYYHRAFRFDSRIWATIKPALRAIFNGKCAYCESYVGAVGHGDLENYRPKSRYPHLAYELSNLLFTCSICNQRYKGDKFPLESEPPSTVADQADMFGDTRSAVIDIANEKPLLLNPYFDQPQEHLVFSEDEGGAVRVTGLTERGRVSIDLLGLNRPELLEMRARTWRLARTMFDALASSRMDKQLRNMAISELQQFVADSGVYAGAVRQLCRKRFETTKLAERDKSLFSIYELLQATTVHISTQQKARADHEHEVERAKLRSYSVEDTAPEDTVKFNYAAKRIDRIEVKNLRAIPYLDFTFPAMGEQESWIVLIGENGVGKSTILQGVALALMGEERANEYGRASTYVRRGETAGFVKVHINSVGTITLHFESGSDKFRVDPPEPKIPLLAYGPTRLLPSDTENAPLTDRNIRTDNLFKATIPLSDAESWLAETWEADKEAFRNIGRALCRLLSISERTLPRVQDGRVEIRMPDGWREISDLSAGYRSVLALLVDIAIGTSGKRRFVEDAVGIVLLDEIEVHLHPSWKIQIVERLRRVFPQLSFLVTTHDPLCLKGLYDREIVVLRRGRRGVISFATDLPSVDALKTDDILTSKELFELPSSRNRTSPVTIARYSALLNKPTHTANEKRELRRLGRVIREMLSGALTPMQREVEHVVATVMSELRAGNSGRQLKTDVLAEVRRQVSEMGGPE